MSELGALFVPGRTLTTRSLIALLLSLDLGWLLAGPQLLLLILESVQFSSLGKIDDSSGLVSRHCAGSSGLGGTKLLLSMFSLASLLIIYINSSIFSSSENY